MPDKKAKGRKPDEIDAEVGARVRMRRLMLNMTQTDLANALGISFQQVQKYENGINRISSSSMQRIAAFFSVPVSFFFEDQINTDNPATMDEQMSLLIVREFLASADGLELIKAFMKIERPQMRRSIVNLVKDIN